MSAWLQTYHNHRFHLLDPKPEEIDIRDIIHALSHENRFSGHTEHPYSVAQHSILVMEQVRFAGLAAGHTATIPDLMRLGLMHDASEAYMRDIPRPLKELLPGYRMLEIKVEDAIARKFNLPATEDLKAMVKEADEDLLYTEALTFFGPVAIKAWNISGHLAHPVIEEQVKRFWEPEYARRRFRSNFFSLFGPGVL